jgi:hypothetical protein
VTKSAWPRARLYLISLTLFPVSRGAFTDGTCPFLRKACEYQAIGVFLRGPFGSIKQ